MKKIYLLTISILIIFSPIFTESNNIKTGLVLSGGGVKGLAHLGTLYLIDSLNIPIDYVAGTSIGGITGGLYASGYSPEEIEYICYNSKWDEIFTQNRSRDNLYYFQKKDVENFQLSFILNNFKPSPPIALSSGQYSFEYLTELFGVYDNILNFDNMKIPFRCNATDILTGEEIIFKTGAISRALRASTSIPTVFSPVEYNGSLLVDGGVVNNLPTNLVKNMGANFTIGVNLSSKNSNEVFDIFDMLQKSIGLYGMKNSKKNSQDLDILISPDLPSVNIINFENSIMKDLQKRGEKEAHNKIKLLLNLKEKLIINNDFMKFSGLKDTFKINSVFLNNILIDTTNKSFEIFKDTLINKNTFINIVRNIRKSKLVYNLSYKFSKENNNAYNLYFDYKTVEPTIIDSVIINGNDKINPLEISNMINFQHNDTLDVNKLLNNIRKIYSLDYFQHIYYDVERTKNNYSNLIIDVKENAFQRFKIGATWDNHYKLVGKAKLDLIFKASKIRLQDELIFSGIKQNTFNFYYTMTKNNLLSIIPQIKFVNRIKDIGLFDENYKKYFIRHNFEQKTAGIIIPLKEKGSIELNYNEAKSWYHDENNTENIYPINRLVYTDFKLDIDQLDNLLMPRNGYNMILSYESSITDGTFNTSSLKYSFLEFKFNYYKTFNRDHTLRYYTWYTKSLGDVPLYLQTNYGGYDWAIGYSEYDLYAKNLKIYGCEYQYHYKNSLTFRFILSKPTFIESPIANSNIKELPITYGLGLSVKSIIGPINFIWARGDENLFDDSDKKKNIFYFNFGVKY